MRNVMFGESQRAWTRRPECTIDRIIADDNRDGLHQNAHLLSSTRGLTLPFGRQIEKRTGGRRSLSGTASQIGRATAEISHLQTVPPSSK